MALTWKQHQENIFGGESGGDYDALFGYQNRPDGIFSDVKVSDMSLAQVLDFTNPRGAYGQYVALTRPDPEKGVATPVGAYQVVGSTLRNAVDALGLDLNTKFDKATQDKIGQYILKTQGTGAWEGYGKGGASMADQPTQPQQSQGLLGGILGGQGIGGALGLSDDFRDRLKMGLLLGSDPRAFAPMVAGIQARGKERRAETKEQRQRNKSLEYLKQRADAGDALAKQYYEAASTGVLPVGAGIAGYLEQMTKVPKTSEKERSIQRLVDTGMDRNTATLITEGVLVTSRDPVTGNAVVINKATGATVGQLPSSVADAVAEAEPAAGDGGAFEGLDIPSALGVRGWTSSILNKVTDAVGAGQVAGEAGEVEAALDNLKARTILMSGIDVEGKPSNFTRQIIEEKFTISPSELSTGPVAALQRATEMVDMLEQTLSAVEIAAGGGGGASAQQVKEARASRSGIESLLADYRSLKNALEKKGVSSGASNGQPTVVQTDQDRALIQKYSDPNYIRDNMLPSPD